MAAAKRKRTHGGMRAGAGRPKGEPTESRSFRLATATWELLERICERSGRTQREVITEALGREASAWKLEK